MSSCWRNPARRSVRLDVIEIRKTFEKRLLFFLLAYTAPSTTDSLYSVILSVIPKLVVVAQKTSIKRTHNEPANNVCPSVMRIKQHECSTSRELEFASCRHARCRGCV